MLKHHAHLMVSLLVLADACAIAIGWLFSYWVRFNWLPVDPHKGVPSFSGQYMTMLPLVVAAHIVIFQTVRLYRPRRDRAILQETRDIVKAFFVAVVAIILIDYALPQSNKISRGFIATYLFVGTTCFALFRGSVRVALRALRRRGWNQRSAAIVGSGRAAQQLLHALQTHSWTGINVQYFVGDDASDDATIFNIPVVGPLDDLTKILDERQVDIVFVALPGRLAGRLEDVMTALDTSMADVRFVPELPMSLLIRPDVSELEGVPILSVRQTPLYGWNAVMKRCFDLVIGGMCLLIALPAMAVIALLIRIRNGSPVLYKQLRTGLDGQVFTMLKFRTMANDAEASGPVWSQRQDDRRTRLGAFLRRTSLDELPNLFNVLAGQMSLVGPRPERPEFIERFKDEIPNYMIRHKIKAGMTGFAQIKGYRGQTSLKKRIQHDVHYINHWSLRLDLRILAQTVAGAWFSKHEG